MREMTQHYFMRTDCSTCCPPGIKRLSTIDVRKSEPNRKRRSTNFLAAISPLRHLKLRNLDDVTAALQHVLELLLRGEITNLPSRGVTANLTAAYLHTAQLTQAYNYGKRKETGKQTLIQLHLYIISSYLAIATRYTRRMLFEFQDNIYSDYIICM